MRSFIILLLAISRLVSNGQSVNEEFKWIPCNRWKTTDLKGGTMEVIDSTEYKILTIIFEVTVNNVNKVTKIELLESSDLVADSIIQKCKEMIADINLTVPKSSQLPEVTKGRVTYCIAERKKIIE